MKPTAHLSVDRRRRKTNGGAYYIENGTQFEVELFNPTDRAVAAEVEIDGRAIGSSMVVLRPGERVFLERFMDEARRFRFETYETDGSPEAERATRSNGLVTVRFHNERDRSYVPVTSPLTTPVQPWIVSQWSPTRYTTNTLGCPGPAGVACNFSASVDSGTSRTKSTETGRTEAGSASAQSFVDSGMQFDAWVFHTETFRILPASRAPRGARVYCTNCGKRAKGERWKFCPKCGTSLS